MRKFSAILFVAILGLATRVHAGDYALDPIVLAVPAGFEGPISQSREAATMTAFRKPKSGSDVATLLQITVYDLGEKIPKLSRQDLDQGAEKYLRDFISGVESHRTDFVLSPVVHFDLAGIPAAKVAWTGKLNGQPVNGEMYALIVGRRIVSFHTQDGGSTPTDDMKAAMKAIESVHVNAAH